jgi:hypothetical protein
MGKKSIRIRENSFIARVAAYKLGADSVALTLGRTIHLHNARADNFKKDRRWVLHELKHVEQFKRYGFFWFIVLYLLESIRKGYHGNRFEVEAREAEEQVDLFAGIDQIGSQLPDPLIRPTAT